jgi:hypothetical protein
MVVSRLFFEFTRFVLAPNRIPEPQPQLSTTITNANTKTNEHQYNTSWDECIYIQNPIPVRLIVSTPSDSIPLRIHSHGQGAARRTLQKKRQSAKHLPFPLQYQPFSPSSMKDVMA